MRSYVVDVSDVPDTIKANDLMEAEKEILDQIAVMPCPCNIMNEVSHKIDEESCVVNYKCATCGKKQVDTYALVSSEDIEIE